MVFISRDNRQHGAVTPMDCLPSLPAPPAYSIKVLEDRSPSSRGFLRYVSRLVCTVDANGVEGESLIYDEVDRESLDAVVIVPYFFREGPEGKVPWVVLRSAIRPPVALRLQERSPMEEPENRGLWECPAGLIEPLESSPTGIFVAAARELREETGFHLAPDALHPLGPSTFPCPGLVAERQFFFRALVDPGEAKPPLLDGSPLEEAGQVVAVPLSAAFSALFAGALADAKTEIALYRLRSSLQAEGVL